MTVSALGAYHSSEIHHLRHFHDCNYWIFLLIYQKKINKYLPFYLRWEKAVGDSVSVDEVLCEVETDKTSVPVSM